MILGKCWIEWLNWSFNWTTSSFCHSSDHTCTYPVFVCMAVIRLAGWCGINWAWCGAVSWIISYSGVLQWMLHDVILEDVLSISVGACLRFCLCWHVMVTCYSMNVSVPPSMHLATQGHLRSCWLLSPWEEVCAHGDADACQIHPCCQDVSCNQNWIACSSQAC